MTRTCTSSGSLLLMSLTFDRGSPDLPLHLHVTLTSSDEVLRLRQELLDEQSAAIDLRTKLQRCEYLLMCEYQISEQLMQLLRDNGIKIPRRFTRWRDQPKK